MYIILRLTWKIYNSIELEMVSGIRKIVENMVENLIHT